MSADLFSLHAVADYLPHRPPMVLLDRIDEVTADRVTCSTTLRADCIFALDGTVHASAMLEFVAQACAIHANAGARTRTTPGEPRPGMLISCREATLYVETFSVGDELSITATRLPTAPPLTTFDATVHRRGELCVRLQLSVMEGAA